MDSSNRISELDGLRGVAVLMVVALHYIDHHLQAVPGSSLSYGQAYFAYLWAGVDIFFVLSGYLLGGILLENRTSANGLKVFYARRATRILPPYTLLLVSYLVVSWWWAVSPRTGLEWLMERPRPFWSYIFFLHNFEMVAANNFGALFVAATWSLAVEEQFYLMLPWIVRRVSIALLPYVCIGFIVCAPIFRFALHIVEPHATLAPVLLLFTRWDSLFFGVLAAYLVRYTALPAMIARHRAKFRLVLFLALLMAVAVPFIGRMHSVLSDTAIYSIIAGLAALLLIHLNVFRQGAAGRILRTRVLTYFGKISYSLYLFHTAVLGIFFAIFLKTEPRLAGGTDAMVMAGAFAFTVIFAELSWRYFESPFVSFGHRLKYSTAKSRNLENVELEGLKV